MKKQLPEVYYDIRYSLKFLKIHRKTLRPATLLKKRLWHKCFPINSWKIFKNTFLTKHVRVSASVYELYHKYFVFPTRFFFLLVILSNSILTTDVVSRLFRRCHRKCAVKRSALKTFIIFTGKTLACV